MANLFKMLGKISRDAIEEMEAAIEEACEQIDPETPIEFEDFVWPDDSRTKQENGPHEELNPQLTDQENVSD